MHSILLDYTWIQTSHGILPHLYWETAAFWGIYPIIYSQRQYNFQIQPYFHHISKLMCDRCINVDTTLLCLLGYLFLCLFSNEQSMWFVIKEC